MDYRYDQEYIKRQSDLFDAKKAELLPEYDGLYVHFEDGNVLYSGQTLVDVVKHAYANGGMRPIFVELVSSKEKTVLECWSNFGIKD